MRALIRADLKPHDVFNPSMQAGGGRSNSTQHDDAIMKIFEAMGYKAISSDEVVQLPENDTIGETDPARITARSVGNPEFRLILQDNQGKLRDTIIEYIFRDVPEGALHERDSVVMVGYASYGQLGFVVSRINHAELHIRVRGDTFIRIKNTCADIQSKAELLTPKYPRLLNSRLQKYDAKSKKPHIILNRQIEVLEPHQHTPTINGRIISSAIKEAITDDRIDELVALSTGIAALVLFLVTPYMADHVADVINAFTERIYSRSYTDAYISNAMERLFSALLVTSMVTFISFAARVFSLRRFKPIKWSNIADR